MVSLQGLAKSFNGREALKDVTAEVPRGKITGLVGADGAGKTTLIRLMAGLLNPSAGTLEICGLQLPRDKKKLAERIGYMPQRFGLYEDLTVAENLNLYARLRGLPAKERQQNCQQVLELTRLTPFIHRLAGRLSGGMKQKLGIACSILGRPALLLLDEPGVGVDPLSRRDLWQMVQSLVVEGVTVIWATAYMDEAELCPHVLLLDQGRLLYAGAPEQLVERVKGASFRVRVGRAQSRALLSELLTQPWVGDAVSLGDGVRVVLRTRAMAEEEELPPLPQAEAWLNQILQRYQAHCQPVTPRFEDAFLTLYDPAPHTHSSLRSEGGDLADTQQTVVACRDLCRRFGDFVAVDGVDFTVRRGEIFGLLGPNGAGKSTTFRMLCGLLSPSSGQGVVVGVDLARARADVKSKLGYMAQKFSLYSLLSVRQNLSFSAGVYGLRGRAKKERIAHLVDTFQLQDVLDDEPESLPLGVRQRLSLACALMHQPPILFLDEPTSGVDPRNRREFWRHINGLARQGVTVLVTTHFLEEAEYCDRIALMHQSKLLAVNTPTELKKKVAREGEELTMEQTFVRIMEQADLSGRDATGGKYGQ